ncbi:hypothetical protein [Streptomyces chattanoogensis]|uniref:hypothetical protein n=1 Tax=Streptomyces chattanoogensis TaxID=66876 RepID=UPI0036BDF090
MRHDHGQQTVVRDKTAVSRTVDACETHGPDSRIERIYVTTELLDAVTGVAVIEVPLSLSDHHLVRLTLDSDQLSDILNRQTDGTARA